MIEPIIVINQSSYDLSSHVQWFYFKFKWKLVVLSPLEKICCDKNYSSHLVNNCISSSSKTTCCSHPHRPSNVTKYPFSMFDFMYRLCTKHKEELSVEAWIEIPSHNPLDDCTLRSWSNIDCFGTEQTSNQFISLPCTRKYQQWTSWAGHRILSWWFQIIGGQDKICPNSNFPHQILTEISPLEQNGV